MGREQLQLWADSCDKTIREVAQAGLKALDERDELQKRLDRIHALVRTIPWDQTSAETEEIANLAKGKD